MQLDEPNTRTSPQMVGDSKVAAAFARAENAAEAYIAKRRFNREQAQAKWVMKSNERYQENDLRRMLGTRAGRIDDTYTAEVPLTLGWNSYEDGTSLAFVSLGGVDVSAYLPPDVLADIQSHVLSKWEDEQ